MEEEKESSFEDSPTSALQSNPDHHGQDQEVPDDDLVTSLSINPPTPPGTTTPSPVDGNFEVAPSTPTNHYTLLDEEDGSQDHMVKSDGREPVELNGSPTAPLRLLPTTVCCPDEGHELALNPEMVSKEHNGSASERLPKEQNKIIEAEEDEIRVLPLVHDNVLQNMDISNKNNNNKTPIVQQLSFGHEELSNPVFEDNHCFRPLEPLGFDSNEDIGPTVGRRRVTYDEILDMRDPLSTSSSSAPHPQDESVDRLRSRPRRSLSFSSKRRSSFRFWKRKDSNLAPQDGDEETLSSNAPNPLDIMASAVGRRSSDEERSRPKTLHEQTIDTFMTKQLIEAIKNQTKAQATPYYGAEYSLFLFSPTNRFRLMLLDVTCSRWFEIFINIIIALSIICLAVVDPTKDDSYPRNRILDEIGYAFLGVFTIEMAVKVIAYGFVLDRGSYLRHGWNMLDFIIVVTGLIEVIVFQSASGQGADMKVLRALRIIRTFRLIQASSSLQLVLNSILRSVPRLLHVGIWTFLVVLLYALIGMEFYSGGLDYECFYNATNEPVLDGRRCSISSKGHHCEIETQYCAKGEGLNDGLTSFDNIGIALLTVFQILTLEGWSTVYYGLNDHYGGDVNWLYFTSLIIFGSYFILNLVLGVVSGQFEREGTKSERQRWWRKYHEKKAMEEHLDNYMEWMQAAKDHTMLEEIHRRGQEVVTTSPEDDGHLSKKEQEEEAKYRFEIRARRSGLSNKEKILPVLCPHPEVAEVVLSKKFVLFVMGLVLINTLLLAMQYYDEPDTMRTFLRISNLVFDVIFTMEMILKIWALSFRHFASSKLNIVDAVVVVIGLIEGILLEAGIIHPYGLAVLRSIRLLRLLKLTSYWTPLNMLVAHLYAHISSILSLLGLLQLFIVIFALLGMKIFGGKFDGLNDGSKPQANYDSFWHAYLTVFQILTGQNWVNVMFDGVRAYGGIDSWDAFVALYFVTEVVLGNYIVLNIFLAIAVDSLQALQEAQRMTKAMEEYESLVQGHIMQANPLLSDPSHNIELQSDLEDLDGSNGDLTIELQTFTQDAARLQEESSTDPLPVVDTHLDEERLNLAPSDTEMMKNEDTKSDFAAINVPTGHAIPHHHGVVTFSSTGLRGEFVEEPSDDSIPNHDSLYIFSPSNGLRLKCFSLLTYPKQQQSYFESFILVCIIVNSIMMAVEDPVDHHAGINRVLFKFDYAFTAIFIFEMVIKIIAFGLVFHPHAYLKSSWNILDMVVVVLAIIALILETIGVSMSVVRIFRVLRVLRPLRAISRAQKLRQVIQCLISSVMQIGPIFILVVTTLFLFSVIGVQQFEGGFFSCNDPDILYRSSCIGYFNVTNSSTGLMQLAPREWSNEYLNFDNVGKAMVTLFSASTTEGWDLTMYRTMAITYNEGKGPVEYYQPSVGIYWIFFMTILTFFFLNLFIGYVIVRFQYAIEDDFEGCEFSKSQRKCIEYCFGSKLLRSFIPENPTGVKHFASKIVVSPYFNWFIVFSIVLNIFVLALKHEGMSSEWELGIFLANAIFTSIFAVEAILKIYVLSIRGYIYDSWNIFDFVVVLGSFVDIALSHQAASFTFFRLFRSVRLVKLMRQGKLKQLMFTFIRAVRSLPWVGLLIALLYFIYAIVGMHVFGRVALHDDKPINSQANFRTFPRALITLFRSATGEDWQTFVQGCQLSPPDCDPHDPEGSTCGNAFAIPFFISFIGLFSFLIVNLFVAIIVDNFDYLTDDWAVLGPHHLEEYSILWCKYDPQATGKISHSDFVNLLRNALPPLGLGMLCPLPIIHHVLMRFDVPMNSDGTVNYCSTFMGLLRYQAGIMKGSSTEDVRNALKKWFNISEKELNKYLPIPTKECAHDYPCECFWSIRFYYTVLRLQYLFRKKRKALAERRRKSSVRAPNVLSLLTNL